ncbi:type VII secretion target [Gordonia sp. DT30]|uniref:type VII secretion target n=1 Tax=unclassified Gordonia (in: high G+C Gram-positive bacteria) TaxID=2657482 RepID=UPI003CFB2DD1
MAPPQSAQRLHVNPAHLHNAGKALASCAQSIAGSEIPDFAHASGSLSQMRTGQALSGVTSALHAAIGVLGGRYTELSDLLHNSASAFVNQDNADSRSMRLAANELLSVGDLNQPLVRR